MVLNETTNSTQSILAEVIKQVTPMILDKIQPLMGIFKAVGVLIIIYLLFLIYRSFVRIQDHRRLKRIEEKVDMLLTKQKKHR